MKMNWKQEAEEKLRSYAARKRATAALPQQIEEVRVRRQGVRSASLDGMAVSGGGSGRESMMVSSIVYQEELERRLEAETLWVAGVEAALEKTETILGKSRDEFPESPCYHGSIEYGPEAAAPRRCRLLIRGGGENMREARKGGRQVGPSQARARP